MAWFPDAQAYALLSRLRHASRHNGAVSFEPFCGCGPTVDAAQETERQWIGCDMAILAVRLVSQVLEKRYRLVEGTPCAVHGMPVSVAQAEALFNKDLVPVSPLGGRAC